MLKFISVVLNSKVVLKCQFVDLEILLETGCSQFVVKQRNWESSKNFLESLLLKFALVVLNSRRSLEVQFVQLEKLFETCCWLFVDQHSGLEKSKY